MPIVHGTWQGFCSAQFASIDGLPPQIGSIQASPSGPAQIHGFTVDALFLANGSPLTCALVGAPSNLVFTLSFVDDVGNHISVLSTNGQAESYGPGGLGSTGYGTFWFWGSQPGGGSNNLTVGRQYTITWT